jgi:hypothetical protein
MSVIKNARSFFGCLAAAALIALAPAARADAIAVPVSDWTGSRSTPDSAGIVAFNDWTAANGGIKISWNITFDGGTNLYTYVYTFTNADGSTLSPDLSHWLLETSPDFTAGDIGTGSRQPIEGPVTWTEGMGNPGIPSPLFGIKFDSGSDVSASYTLISSKSPIWGDFYAKDGGGVGAGSVHAYNTNCGTDPTGSTMDVTGWIPVPDTNGPTTAVPAPPALVLMGIGGVGLLAARYRRKK